MSPLEYGQSTLVFERSITVLLGEWYIMTSMNI